MHLDARQIGTIRSMALSPICLTTKQSKECPWADHSLFENILTHYSKTSHYPLQVGTYSFEGISPLYPRPLHFSWQSNKAILFHFTQTSVSEIWFGVRIQRLDSASLSGLCSPHLCIASSSCSTISFIIQ